VTRTNVADGSVMRAPAAAIAATLLIGSSPVRAAPPDCTAAGEISVGAGVRAAAALDFGVARPVMLGIHAVYWYLPDFFRGGSSAASYAGAVGTVTIRAESPRR